MENPARKAHWEKVFRTTRLDEVGWYQQVPTTSLELIGKLNLKSRSKIIDAGGGDSALAGHLLDHGFEDITVLDISSAAIARARDRLGHNANRVNWITSDILDFSPVQKFELWHDRASFHFLTNDTDIEKYVRIATTAVRSDGFLIIGTFSDTGPTKCSGLQITQYSIDSLVSRFSGAFKKIGCLSPVHVTPGGGMQHYTFCSFQKKA